MTFIRRQLREFRTICFEALFPLVRAIENRAFRKAAIKATKRS